MSDMLLSSPEQLPFIGRRHEMNNVVKAFTSTILTYMRQGDEVVHPLTKLALICGGPLVGKTRFAAEAAQELQKFVNVELNVHSVELQGLSNPRQVEMKMASALLPWQQRDDGMMRGVGDVVGDLEEWHLFVLDGAECFGGNDRQSGFMELCQEVIGGSSRVLIMITSQWKFNFIRIMNQVI